VYILGALELCFGSLAFIGAARAIADNELWNAGAVALLAIFISGHGAVLLAHRRISVLLLRLLTAIVVVAELAYAAAGVFLSQGGPPLEAALGPCISIAVGGILMSISVAGAWWARPRLEMSKQKRGRDAEKGTRAFPW
jgi:hypothetical protein